MGFVLIDLEIRQKKIDYDKELFLGVFTRDYKEKKSKLPRGGYSWEFLGWEQVVGAVISENRCQGAFMISKD